MAVVNAMTKKSVNIWHDAIWHQTTVSVPVMLVFHSALEVISQTPVYKKNGKVDWVEVWQNVLKTYTHRSSKLTQIYVLHTQHVLDQM